MADPPSPRVTTPLSAPILSTPDTHILDHTTPAATTGAPAPAPLSDNALHSRYEIRRTTREIHVRRWRRVALQFPDAMLHDAPRVYALLQEELNAGGVPNADEAELAENDHGFGAWQREEEEREDGLERGRWEKVRREIEGEERARQGVPTQAQMQPVAQPSPRSHGEEEEEEEEIKLFILADTTYSACCVDEVAAEHVCADAVVHYGRACLSPSARGLPAIYVFGTRPLDVQRAARALRATFPGTEDKVAIVADAPYAAHAEKVARAAGMMGKGNVFATRVVRDPGAWIPNRTAPREEGEDEARTLRGYHVFHLGEPPTALLLTLAARVKSIRVYVPDDAAARSPEEELEERLAALGRTLAAQSEGKPQQQLPLQSGPSQPEPPAAPAPVRATAHLLKRRYAVVTAISTASTFGILINTLSTRDHQLVAAQVRADIAAAGRKSYTFAVGRANPAKLANFAEIEAWIVIGCWESSLIDGKEFMAPMATPFELRLGLTPPERRVWSGEWAADFEAVLAAGRADGPDGGGEEGEGAPDGAPESAPPEYDFRTGRYVARGAPARRAAPPPPEEGGRARGARAGPAGAGDARARRRREGRRRGVAGGGVSEVAAHVAGARERLCGRGGSAGGDGGGADGGREGVRQRGGQGEAVGWRRGAGAGRGPTVVCLAGIRVRNRRRAGLPGGNALRECHDSTRGRVLHGSGAADLRIPRRVVVCRNFARRARLSARWG